MRQLAQIEKAATSANLPFVLIGGWAVCAHGYSRLTQDLDLLAEKSQRARWGSILGELGYLAGPQPEAFGHWTPPPNEPGYTFLDVMFVNENAFSNIISAAQNAIVEGTSTKVPSLEHLFALKFHAIRSGGERRKMKDYIDVTYLIDINKVDTKSDWFRDLCLKYGSPEIYENLRGKN